jgi:histidyl-tRNA synthetase
MRYSAPRGTQDVLPRDAGKWRMVEDHVRRVCDLYGYEEIRTPIFEQTELFVRGIGEVTDIVEKEMYTFPDKRGRSMTLRPEGTAPVARAFIEHKMFSEPRPVKLYYIGPMFRYERPQAGRQRQFSQFGIEAFGSGDAILDAEVIDLAYTLYRGLGLHNSTARINTIGCPACRPHYNEHIKEKMSASLDRLCTNCRSRYERNPMRILDCKTESCRKIAAKVEPISSFLCAECAEHFSAVQESLRAMSVPFELDPTIVRGFDYYTRTVFEFVSSGIGAQDAIGGGGRYDGLIESCGGPPTPGVGFAAGIDRLLLAIEASGAIDESERMPGCFVAAVGDGARLSAARLVASLRRHGVSADMDYMGRSLRAQMRHADRMNVRTVVILGEDELRAGVIQVKDMNDGEQWEVPLEGAADAICTFLQPAGGR